MGCEGPHTRKTIVLRLMVWHSEHELYPGPARNRGHMAKPEFDSDSDQSRYKERIEVIQTRLSVRFQKVRHEWDADSKTEVFAFSRKDENFRLNVPRATLVLESVGLFYIESNVDNVKGSSWKSILLTPTEGLVPLE